jgi:hypothetical protein
VEQSKWTSWHGLGSMPSAEAMRLFVKILEEEDPGWYSRISEFNSEPVVDIQMHKPKEEPQIVPASTNGTSISEPKIISENGSSVETQDKDVILEGLSTVSSHDEWTPLSISGHRPKPRYEVRQISPFPIHAFNYFYFSIFFYSNNKNFCNCSMERLCCKIRCMYLVETITGVTLVTFRLWI